MLSNRHLSSCVYLCRRLYFRNSTVFIVSRKNTIVGFTPFSVRSMRLLPRRAGMMEKKRRKECRFNSHIESESRHLGGTYRLCYATRVYRRGVCTERRGEGGRRRGNAPSLTHAAGEYGGRTRVVISSRTWPAKQKTNEIQRGAHRAIAESRLCRVVGRIYACRCNMPPRAQQSAATERAIMRGTREPTSSACLRVLRCFLHLGFSPFSPPFRRGASRR